MADKVTNKRTALLDNTVIENLIDRQLINLLNELPDPDIILRKAGIDHLVYNEILADPHIIGEVRSMRSGLLSYKYEITAGDDSAQSAKALELCKQVMKNEPHHTMRWPDLMWSIGKAPLVGRRVHHVKWEVVNRYLMPVEVFDIDPQSFAFAEGGELLIKTMQKPAGDVAEPYRWLVTRHMPDTQNPYGVALLSTCFWPWMFKNGGMKYFVKFCEKYGIPWPVAKYPLGTEQKDIDTLVDRLSAMVEDAVAAIPEDNSIDIIETTASGDLPQERLINLMNREMSKALTSQSLATEINGQGSRAASETHIKRSEVNQKTDRALVADTLNQLFDMITDVNFGVDVPAPRFTYVDKKELNTNDVLFFEKASALVPIKRTDIYERLELSEPADTDDVVFKGNATAVDDNSEESQSSFAKGDEPTWDKEDIAISELVDQVKAAIDKGETLEEALLAVEQLLPEIDSTTLDQLMRNELEIEYGLGMIETNTP